MAYIVRRLLFMVPVVFGVSLVTYVLVQLLPGGPVTAYLGQEGYSPQAEQAMKHRLGLDRPIPIQYLDWLGHAVRGDFGDSVRTGQGVFPMIGERAMPTAQLGIAALVLSILVGLPLGMFAAVHRGTWVDWISSTVAVLGLAMPSFWLAILLMSLLSVRLGVLPSSGYVSLTVDPAAWFKHLVMPTVALGTAGAGVLMRQTRSAMLEVLHQDFVRTARAKGLAERTVLMTHALRPALLPVVTIIGLSVGSIIGGSVIMEQIFAIPGVGRLALSSITGGDFLVVQGIVLLTTLVVIAVNTLTDVAYVLIDPRVRFTR